MYSGADMEAFMAATGKDIEGNVSASQLSDSHTASRIQHDQNIPHQQVLHSFGLEPKLQRSIAEYVQQKYDTSEELNQFPLLQEGDRQKGLGEQNTSQILEKTVMSIQEKNPISTQQDITSNPESEFRYFKLPKISSQKEMITEGCNLQLPFDFLLPRLLSGLDRNRGLQLTTLYSNYKKKELSRTEFYHQMGDVAGKQLVRSTLMEAINRFQMTSMRPAPKHQLSPPASGQQLPPGMFSVNADSTQSTDPHSFLLYQRGANSAMEPSDMSSSTVQMQIDSSHGMQLTQMTSPCTLAANPKRKCSSSPTQVPNEKQQKQLHPQSSVAKYGSTDGESGGEAQAMSIIGVSELVMQNSVLDPSRLQGGSLSHFTNNSTSLQNPVPCQSSNKGQNIDVLTSMAYVNWGPDDRASDQQQKPPLSLLGLPYVSAPQVELKNVSPEISTTESSERHSLKPTSIVPSSAATTVHTNPVSPTITTQVDAKFTLGPHIHSRISPAEIDGGTPLGNAFIGKKKPRKVSSSSKPSSKNQNSPAGIGGTPPGNTFIGKKKRRKVGSSSEPSSKQKVSGTFLHQNIERDNDVTVVSGINLREEEEQLLSGPNEDYRASEASGPALQEEEERLILQKIPLMKKLGKITARCGLKSIKNDVERCLSLCVEERMRGLINNLIGLSKQRVDAQTPRCHTITTSNVQLQILNLNLAARKKWEKRQMEEQAVQKLSEPQVSDGVNHNKDKDQGGYESFKANKEDDRMRTAAANVAALTALGGDDMLSRWKLIAEQGRRKRERGFDAPSVPQDVNHKPTLERRIMRNNQETEKMGDGAGTFSNFGENQVVMPETRVVRSISVKDVISVLETEPQMAKSPLTYLLYERNRSDIAVEDSKLQNTVPIIS